MDTLHVVTRADILEALTHATHSLTVARATGKDTTNLSARIDDLLEQLTMVSE